MKDKDMKTIDRRGVLKTGGKLIGAAALLKAAGAVVPGGAWAAEAKDREDRSHPRHHSAHRLRTARDRA